LNTTLFSLIFREKSRNSIVCQSRGLLSGNPESFHPGLNSAKGPAYRQAGCLNDIFILNTSKLYFEVVHYHIKKEYTLLNNDFLHDYDFHPSFLI